MTVTACAVVFVPIVLALFAGPMDVANPQPIYHFGLFYNDGNAVIEDDEHEWTNRYRLTILCSSNQVDWETNSAPLEICNSILTFPITNDSQQKFCRVMFTPIPQ